MSRSDTWMPVYIGDYLGDTSHLRMAEHGAYILLLFHYWRNGPLPDDDAKLAAIVRGTPAEWRKVAPAVREFFTSRDGRLYQKRADVERGKATSISAKRAAAGLAGAQQKHGKRGGKILANASYLPSVCQTQLQSQEQDKSPDLRSGAGGAAGLFGELPTDRPPSIRAQVYTVGLPLIRAATGQSEAQARSLLGKLLSQAGDDCARVLRALNEAADLKPAEPVAWLMAACGRGQAGRKPGRMDWLARELRGEE